MPRISRKGRLMPQSPIRKLAPFAEEAKKNGKQILYLNIGQPDIATPEVALSAIKNFDHKVVEYSHSAGFTSYREKLAKYYQKIGLNVNAEDILITTGGSEALLFGFMACFDQGEELIIPEPFYANYYGFAVASGVNVSPIIADINDGFALPPIEEFEKIITPRTRGILLCNPANPTGYLYTKQELHAIAEIVKSHDLFLFADEVYREFAYDGRKHHSVLEIPGLDDHIVMVDSVSKRYSMCGARVGAMITKNKELMNTALKFAQARLSPPTFGQVASEAALDTPASYFEEVIEEYVERRNLLVNGLNNIPGVICPNPGGAFYCMVELPIDDSDKFCEWLIRDFQHKGTTVMLAPGSGFYSNSMLGSKQARVAYVLEKEKLQLALECLEIALEQYPGTER